MESIYEKNQISREEATAFIDSSVYFYRNKWETHSETTFKGWNWAAMFFGIEWMVYRKMYLEALVTFISISCLSLALSFYFNFNISYWLFRILFGVAGNALYWKKTLRVMRKIHAQYGFEPDDSRRFAEISRRGGVNMLAVAIVILLDWVVGFLIYFYL